MISGVRVKLKASSEKVCQFMVEMVTSCMNEAKKSRHSADEAEKERLQEKCAEDAPPLKAEGPQRADLGYPVGHCGIHGDHGADHRPEREDDRQRHAENPEELGHRLGLVCIVFRLPSRLQGQARIGLDPLLEAPKVVVSPSRKRTDE